MSNQLSLVRLVFREETRRAELEPPCTAVLEHFALQSQPLCCIFDDEERSEFIVSFGDSFCGFFYPVAQEGLDFSGFHWPYEIRTNVTDVWREIENGGPCQDVVLVYLRKDTCDRVTGTTITFAYELQHVAQHLFHYKEWKANRWLEVTAVPEMVDPKPWHFPIEYEVQLVSKRVAEVTLGREEVVRYANERITSGDDPHKWSFFLGLDVSQEYDFVGETRRMVETHREKLEALCRKYPPSDGDPDFRRADWWV